MKTIIGHDIQKAAELLRGGELVEIPTETVYGLAANALDADAVVKIFEAKDRPYFDPLIVHLHSFAEAEKHVTTIPLWAEKLAKHFCPGPITFVLPKKPIIPDIVTSGLDTVGIRIPDHPLTQELLRILNIPLAAPSANPFGYISPTTAEHVNAQLGGKIPYILDGGECKVGVESTIIGEKYGKPVILRLGGISVEQVREVIGDVKIVTHSAGQPLSPGSLESHYSPKKKLIYDDFSDWDNYPADKKAVIAFSKPMKELSLSQQRILSSTRDLHEAAKNLFGAMRELDGLSVDAIFAEKVPDEGIGRAINDRLRRASS